MGQTTTTERDRLTTGILVGSIVVATTLFALGIAGTLPWQAVGGVLQVLGIALAAFGVDVVRTSLQRAADSVIAAKHGIARWGAMRREQLHHWWLRLRGRPVTIHRSGSGTATASGSVSSKGVRGRLDRDAMSDREWLADLENQVADLWAHMTRAEDNRAADRAELDERLAADLERLRDEIVSATRQGWELVVAGLICSAIGTTVGIWA